jgi:hypothetical protein
VKLKLQKRTVARRRTSGGRRCRTAANPSHRVESRR